jgi:hypothetical protein
VIIRLLLSGTVRLQGILRRQIQNAVQYIVGLYEISTIKIPVQFIDFLKILSQVDFFLLQLDLKYLVHAI